MQAAPPGILDLIPCGPSSPHNHDDAFDLEPRIWSHLPENLLHSILSLLPFRSVLRFRVVCKQWKALFASPAFHHFASHRAHVPPLIFFIGSCASRDHNGSRDAFNHYDDGYDDNGYVYEDDDSYADYVSDDSGYVNEDDDNYADYVSDGDGDNQYDDQFMRDDDHEVIDDVTRCSKHVDAHDVMECGDHEEMNDAIRYADHADMYNVLRYDDAGNIHEVLVHDYHGAIHDKDDKSINSCAHDQEESEEDANIEPLLLIFDCESESWNRPLARPPAFNRTVTCNFPAFLHVCTFQEQVLIPSISPFCFFLFNPASPPCKELPPCIAILSLETFGFAEERATLSNAVTSPNLSDLVSMSNETEPRALDKSAKLLHVVAVGNTVNDTNIVESFDSATGSWHVIGRLPQSDDFVFEQMRMMYCKGCFYALLGSGILMMSNVVVGQNLQWVFREFPDPPNRDGGLSGRETMLIDWRIVATRESVFLVGVTVTSFPDTFDHEDWDVILWQFHPSAPANACWEVHAYVPRTLWDTFIGNTHVSAIDSLAHGDLIFFMVPGRRRFLIYDVPGKLWRLSAKCKYFLERMIFVWEPLLRN